MAGGGSRRGSRAAEEVRIGSGNVFAALETLKKKKPAAGAKKQAPAPVKPEVFWAPAPLTTKSWADVEDEDDDDYFATTAPPRPVWGTQVDEVDQEDDKEEAALQEELESEDDSLGDEVDDDAEVEPEHEAEDAVPSEPGVQKAVAPFAPPKDTERQLSKKELKKKGLEELDAVLAELGISDPTQDETNGKKNADQTADGERKEDVPAPPESKTSKKKKAKKEKSSKEAKETQEQNVVMVDEADGAEPNDDAASVDVKERIKKVASMKKKKSSKEMDASAKIAASEAAARRAKLAAAKKKEKNHYNQQPVR